MSALNESISQRMTLEYFHTHYGLKLKPVFARDVTITSIVDDILSVKPGALYFPDLSSVDCKASAGQQIASLGVTNSAIGDDTESSEGRDGDSQEETTEHIETLETQIPLLVQQAELRGAYAVAVSSEVESDNVEASIPLLVGDLSPKELGQALAYAAGDPSAALTIFAVVGKNAGKAAASLAHFLHTLGNPVGLLSSEGMFSLDRTLDIKAPLSMLDVQRALSICLEDGAAAVVIGVDSQTIQEQALQSVQIDVLAFSDETTEAASHENRRFHDVRKGRLSVMAKRYGFPLNTQMQVARQSESSDEMAEQTLSEQNQQEVNQLSLNIAMTVAAGVKRSHIRSALEASRELS